MNLIQISSKLDDLCVEIDEQDGSIPDDLLERFTETKLDHAAKIDAYISIIGILRRDAAFYSGRSEKISRRAKTCEKLEKKILENLKFALVANPDLPWKSTDGDSIKLIKGQDSLEMLLSLDRKSYSNIISPIDYDLVPLQFVTDVTFRTLNTDAVKHYLKQGGDLQWAKLETNSHVRIT